MKRDIKKALPSLVFALFFLASCATFHHHTDEDHEHHHSHHDHENAGRLLVHTNDGSVFVLDSSDGDVLAEYRGQLDAGAAMVNVSSSGEFGFVTHRENWLTLVVDSGFELEEHGDHYDLHIEDPRMLGTVLTGAKPSHFYSALGKTLFYNDDEGTMSLFEDRNLRRSLEFQSIKARVDHGAPLITGDSIVVGYLNHKEIDILGFDGRIKQTLPTGNRLHGEARIGRFIAFGLVEGVGLLTWDGKQYSGKVLPKSSAIEGDARVNFLRSHVLVPHFIARTNTGNYLVKIDPVSGDWTVRTMPDTFSQFGFDSNGRCFAVLDNSGVLYSINIDNLEIIGSIQAAVPEKDKPSPVMALGRGHAWVSDPRTNTVILINLEDLDIEERFSLPEGGVVDALGLMRTSGVVH